MSDHELRDFLAGDIHHEMATAAGILKVGATADVQRELGERLSSACERLREQIADMPRQRSEVR